MRPLAVGAVTLAAVWFAEVHTGVQPAESHFDHVTITRSTSPESGARRRTAPGREAFENVSIDQLIHEAYGRDYQLVNVPEWAVSERYDVVTTYRARSGGAAARGSLRHMWQAMLEERLALQAELQPPGRVVIRHIARPTEK